ncbi:MAG: hypothetical protein ABI591_14375 [Kofleriaceae bacterium]
MSPVAMLAGVRIETLDDRRWSTPYRGIVTMRPRLRLTASIAGREVRIDVDDASIEVVAADHAFSLSGVEALFVVERQPPAWRFLTWYGVFARRHGKHDRMIIETPEGRVARFVERQIEARLGLRDVPVRGEVRCG